MRRDKTRARRASELLDRLMRGPHLFGAKKTIDEAEFRKCYRVWMESWNTAELVDLIPGLRKTRDEWGNILEL